ncbi:hypothetical protein KFE25_014037 [Diacronema lutheri]|uniref:ABC transmembrane type-1 domain-containing protein n=1 Tax=Diacronema lutheri TaxID=2081491 RepID=A0A8J5X8X6_DIALT|nr:hypothetical protein KFE25_014037 [Diacronema lutheri]
MRALSALALAFLGAAPRTGLLRLRFASPAVRGRLAGVRACASAASVWDEGAGAGEAEPLAKPATVNELDQNVAVNNGDRWSGERATVDELRAICDEATSTREPLPIIPQWLPTPDWLWKQWRGTIVRHVLPRDVLVVTLFALGIVLFFHAPGVHSIYRKSLIRHLIAVERVWGLASGLVSFTLSFFLTQSYTFWREVYVIVRQVQGRLNDLGLLLAASAARDADGQYTAQSEELLALTARHVRLFNILLYASLTTQFAPLRTPAGLSQLVLSGALTEEERSSLLEASTGSSTVLVWLTASVGAALDDGRIGGGGTGAAAGGAVGAHAAGLATVLLGKLTELRATASSIADRLSGRMPLAYTQLVQILCDLFVLASPLALLHSVGPVGAVTGTALVTFFHRSVLNLAKVLLDPFGNMRWNVNSGISINVATLIQETNLGSERWRIGGNWLPRGARRTSLGAAVAESAGEPPAFRTVA